MKRTEPLPLPKPITRIEPSRRRDDTPTLPPRVATDAVARPTPPGAPADLEAARRRIEQLELVLREARAEGQRLRLEVSALSRLEPAPPPKMEPPPIGVAIIALVAGVVVAVVGGEAFLAVAAGLGSFAAIVVTRRWTETRADK